MRIPLICSTSCRVRIACASSRGAATDTPSTWSPAPRRMRHPVGSRRYGTPSPTRNDRRRSQGHDVDRQERRVADGAAEDTQPSIVLIGAYSENRTKSSAPLPSRPAAMNASPTGALLGVDEDIDGDFSVCRD